jgi:predicted ArsR family transcriptional regulator
VDASALRSIAQIIESEFEPPIEEGQDGWHTVAAIAQELGVSTASARCRIAKMVSGGTLETKQARVVDAAGRAVKCHVYRVRE